VTVGPGASALDNMALQGALQGALQRLGAVGVDAAALQRLGSAHFLVSSSLPPGTLAAAYPATDTVLISADAAGNGWFVDPTPTQDEEFAGGAALTGSAAAGREDLLTAVLHGMGNLAGLADDDGSALMSGTLPTSARHLGALDAAFATLNG
jgi:hypothetical protein